MKPHFRVASVLVLMLGIYACAQDPSPNDAAPVTEQEAETPLLEIVDEALHSTHSLKYTFAATDGFHLTPVNNRNDVFNDTPFAISRAAFLSNDAAVMIHAETVSDQSNASNYDNLPQATWPSSDFRSQGSVCFELSTEDIEDEADPQWLISNGFSPVGTLMLSQAFLSSADYNDEIVISLMLKVSSCSDDTNAAKFQHLQSAITVTARQ